MENKSNTGKIREKRTDVGKGKPPKDKRFSSTNQPDPAKQKITKAKQRFTRELLREMLNQPYKFTEESQIKQQLIKAFGEQILQMSTLEVMALQQMQKAILKADTPAFSLMLDQALGKLVQPVANTDPQGNSITPIQMTLPAGFKFELPTNTEGEE